MRILEEIREGWQVIGEWGLTSLMLLAMPLQDRGWLRHRHGTCPWHVRIRGVLFYAPEQAQNSM